MLGLALRLLRCLITRQGFISMDLAGGSRLHLTDSNTGTANSDGTEIVVSGSDLYIDQKKMLRPFFIRMAASGCESTARAMY